MNLDFDKDTPQNVRNLITEAIDWMRNPFNSHQLLAIRMERIYLEGVHNGITIAQKATGEAMSTFGIAKEHRS